MLHVLSIPRDSHCEYDTLLAFCCDCKYPHECSKNSEKRKELRSEGRFVILSRQTRQGIPGKLHCIVVRIHRMIIGVSKRARLSLRKKNIKVLDGYHSAELGGGHFGRDKTLLKLSEQFYWLGMVN